MLKPTSTENIFVTETPEQILELLKPNLLNPEPTPLPTKETNKYRKFALLEETIHEGDPWSFTIDVLYIDEDSKSILLLLYGEFHNIMLDLVTIKKKLYNTTMEHCYSGALPCLLPGVPENLDSQEYYITLDKHPDGTLTNPTGTLCTLQLKQNK